MFARIFMILVFGGFAVGSVSKAVAGETARPSAPELKVTVDPRMELLTAVQDLAAYGESMGLLTKFDFAYRDEMKKHFEAFKEHRAVSLFRAMSGKAFNFSAPADAMLYFSAPPALEPLLPVNDFTLMRAGGQESLDEFMAALRDFAVESDFEGFYGAHRDLYAKLEEAVRALVDPADILALEKYFGVSAKDYTIILAPMLHRGGYGPRLDFPDGTFQIYAICGPMGSESGVPDFGDAERWQSLFSHEFAHSFVNPTTDRFMDDYRPFAASIAAPIYKMMGGNPNWAWVTDDLLAAEWINENILRAYTSRLNLRVNGEPSAEEELARHEKNGWTDVRKVFALLERYENGRETWPTFIDFYPELVKTFARPDTAEGT
ncbi:MAG: DUF4932 domain-containing protein [Planctomycetota bacterium]|jgi:hypothetical protein